MHSEFGKAGTRFSVSPGLSPRHSPSNLTNVGLAIYARVLPGAKNSGVFFFFATAEALANVRTCGQRSGRLRTTTLGRLFVEEEGNALFEIHFQQISAV